MEWRSAFHGDVFHFGSAQHVITNDEMKTVRSHTALMIHSALEKTVKKNHNNNNNKKVTDKPE